MHAARNAGPRVGIMLAMAATAVALLAAIAVG